MTAAPVDLAVKRCFAPVVDARTRILVLGSLPGEKSLAEGQYYAHRQNRFWHLIGAVIGIDLPAQDYPSRLGSLLQHRIGLWDVVAQAQRKGSLDSQIRAHASNDLPSLLATLPELAVIAFIGGMAAKLGARALAGQPVAPAIVKLPSSSPAHTVPYADKLLAWQALRDWLA